MAASASLSAPSGLSPDADTLPRPLHCQLDNSPPSTRRTSSDLDSARNTPPHPARFSAFVPSNHAGLSDIASLESLRPLSPPATSSDALPPTDAPGASESSHRRNTTPLSTTVP